MTYHMIINSVKTVEEFEDAWTNADYIKLLELFGFPDAKDSKPEELKDLLFMAISDFEGPEAAAILLDYKLSEYLNEGQIGQMSHDMLLDKISEEYSDISLHHELFNINQLLFKAYNGTFPNAKATIIEFEITPNKDVTKEVVLKVLDHTLANNSVIKRLYSDQLAGKEAFDEAESIVWDLKSTGDNSYTMTTSEYWISRDEFKDAEFDAKIEMFVEEED
ncbi:hypothetical protein BXY82_1468 [Gelidibacter sediminis]|uniref:Uncharacterized protein n=1 Tax=Gelidibacter sediminis TaxID=1608710 RepID=A0A4R7PWY0_9FLAO|nr:hypothetical protein [Gelidibacter sediminis]TDU39444.1 hypothetical protein BXY82_1468 [Gelidibacter sediminis]